jgi:4-amino-4-deoxy-L-arabinose transferase-like glycosyltransferase
MARAGRSSLLLAALTIGLLAPFASKPFHVDDTLFLAAARRIVQAPLDPYGFTINWAFMEQPMSEVTKNPPLGAYYIALAGSALGWSELPLHLAFLLPALGVVLGTGLLARQLRAPPLVAGLLVLSTPGFLVSSTNLMCDTPMLALWVASVLLWLRGIERDDHRSLAAAALVATACALTKYFGTSLVPLLALHGFVHKRRLGAWALHLGVPVLALAGYQYWTRSHYGRGLLGDAAAFAHEMERAIPWAWGLVGLSFTGGCLLSAVLLAPWIWPKRWIAIVSVAAAAAGVALGARWLGPAGASFSEGFEVQAGAQFALFVAGGVSILALAVAEVARRRDADTVLLVAWILGTFVFATYVNWVVNVRSVLPMVPAVAILLARRLERRPIGVYAAIVAGGAVALGATHADFALAKAGRTAAAYVHDRTRGRAGDVWFQGHWGFQHYMEARGARPIDVPKSLLRAGDVVAVPENNASTWGFQKGSIARQDDFEVRPRALLCTMHWARGAGFYADTFGPLPFSFGTPPPERYRLYTLAATARAVDVALPP